MLPASQFIKLFRAFRARLEQQRSSRSRAVRLRACCAPGVEWAGIVLSTVSRIHGETHVSGEDIITEAASPDSGPAENVVFGLTSENENQPSSGVVF